MTIRMLYQPLHVFYGLHSLSADIPLKLAGMANNAGRAGNIKLVAVSMLMMMLALKLLETFRVRDARVVASLSLFLCGTQFLFSQGVPMIIYIIACLLSSLIAFMYLQRTEAYAPLGDAPDTDRNLFTELGFGAGLVALALPIGLAVFLHLNPDAIASGGNSVFNDI